MKSLADILIFLFSHIVYAKLEIPKSLTKEDRVTMIEILGHSSSAKILGNPYPLGGYSGIEVGLAAEVISTSEVATLGAKSKPQNETLFQTLTMGKGLYNNIDVFLQFSAFPSEEEILSYGGQIRWGFYQAEFLPAHLSFIAYANTTNFQNALSVVSTGYDLVGGFSVKDVTLYTGIGMLRTSGSFVGGAGGITAEGTTEKEAIQDVHYLAGMSIQFSKLFVAMELDRYTQATYSGKLGFRF